MYEVCGDEVPAPIASGASLCDFGVFAEGEVSVVGGGATARIDGKVLTQGGGLSRLENATLTEEFYTAGTVSIVSSSTGLVFDSAWPQAPVARTPITGSCPETDVMPSGSSLPPGDYGDVSVADLETLDLSAGVYTFKSLTVGGGSSGSLAVPTSGEVSLRVCGDLTVADGATVGVRADARTLETRIEVQGEVAIGAGSHLMGHLDANGAISVEEAATVRGMVRTGSTFQSAGELSSEGLMPSCRRLYDVAQQEPTSPGRLCNYGLFASGALEIHDDGAFWGGDLGGETVTLSDRNLVGGSLLSTGALSLSDDGVVVGQLISGATAATGSYTVLGSATSSSSDVPAVEFPSLPFSCPTLGDDESAEAGGTLTLSPDVPYGNINVWNEATLTLDAPGDYFVGDFRLNSDNVLELPDAGVVRIFACGAVELDDELTITGLDSEDAERLQIVSASTASGGISPAIWLKDASSRREFTGYLMAPYGRIHLGDRTTLNGVAWADSVTAADGVVVNAVGLTGVDCVAAGLDARPTCPEDVVPLPPAEVGACISNADGFIDESCEGFDLALGVACADEVPVCNHGKDAFAGSVTVAYWHASQGQMSIEVPLLSEDGTCEGSVSIAPGACAALACDLPEGVHSMMLDPAQTLGECNAGALDNWSVHDGRNCEGAGEPMTLNYTYNAVCPSGQSARWGLLLWDTETPLSSRIQFSGRTARVESELSSSGWFALGTATSTPDLQRCTYGVAGCPVDLTYEMDLGTSQFPWLELEIEIEPNGYGPLLKDWELTYSCVVDQ